MSNIAFTVVTGLSIFGKTYSTHWTQIGLPKTKVHPVFCSELWYTTEWRVAIFKHMHSQDPPLEFLFQWIQGYSKVSVVFRNSTDDPKLHYNCRLWFNVVSYGNNFQNHWLQLSTLACLHTVSKVGSLAYPAFSTFGIYTPFWEKNHEHCTFQMLQLRIPA